MHLWMLMAHGKIRIIGQLQLQHGRQSCSCELLLFAYITAVVKKQRTVKKSPKAPPLIHFFDPLTT